MQEVPPVTGKQLIKLLIADGWQVVRIANHGVFLKKAFRDGSKITVVPDRKALLPSGTLGAILGPKQTNLGKSGLRRLLELYGQRIKRPKSTAKSK